jgi:hypothetical protein
LKSVSTSTFVSGGKMEGLVRRQRPLGITIIAIIVAVVAILSLLGIILAFVGVRAFVHNGVLDSAATVVLVIGAIIALIELFFAWGLWTLKPWAFWATVIIEVIRLISALYSWLVVHSSLATVFFSMLVAIVVLVYLFADRNVRAAFRT